MIGTGRFSAKEVRARLTVTGLAEIHREHIPDAVTITMRFQHLLLAALVILCSLHPVLADDDDITSIDPAATEPLFTILPIPGPNITLYPPGFTPSPRPTGLGLTSEQLSNSVSFTLTSLTSLMIGTPTSSGAESTSGSTRILSGVSSSTGTSAVSTASVSTSPPATAVSGSERSLNWWSEGMGMGIATGLLILFLAGL